MATNNSNNDMNVGLNLNGNALASVKTLIDHMNALRQAAVDVGAAMQTIEKTNVGMSAKELKNLQLQMKQLTTTPQMLEQQFYRSMNASAQARQLTQVVNSNRRLTNPNTMRDLIDTYGGKTVGEGIQTRLNAAQLKNDTKAIQRAQLEMHTFKAEMEKYNVSLKGLMQIKQEQDRLVSQMLATPIGKMALTQNMQGRLEAQYRTGANQKMVNNYMTNPNGLKPSNSDFITANNSMLKQEQQANAAKIEATQRLMGKLYLDGSKASQKEYNNYMQILAALEEEKVKLQTIANLKRGNLRLQDQEIAQLKKMQDADKANKRLTDLTQGSMKVNTLSAEQMLKLPKENLLQRELAMKTRLKQAKESLRLSEVLQNKEAIKNSRDLVVAYQAELKMIARRKAQLDAPPKTSKNANLVDHYMNNPDLLKPKAGISSQMTAEAMADAQFKNAAKIQAAQSLINKINMDGSQGAKDALDKHLKILAALNEEKARLQVINNARRTGVNLRDQELKTIKESNNQIKASERLDKLVNSKGFNVNTLTVDKVASLSMGNLLKREMAMVERLKQTKEAMRLADTLGNKKALDESTRLRLAYEQELRLIRARLAESRKQQVEAAKSNPLVDRYHQMADGQSSGALLGIQGILMRNYMIWGAFVASISGSYAFLRDFEQALKQTQAISQATNTQVDRLKDNILKVAENSRFSAIEITEAATILAQAGFSMADIEKTLESVTLLATATGSTLKETVDIATASLGAFQLSAENMPKIVNQITQAMNLSKLDIQKFQLAVQYAGNAASDAGLSFEELLASVSTVANAGVRSGSTLGTGFRQLLSDLISPSAKFEKILTRLGLTTADVDVRTNGLVGTLKQLKDAGFSTADAYESFEVRSVAFFTALANNLSTYDDLLANLDSNTAAMDANEIQMGSLSAQTDRMFNQFKALAEVLGEPVRAALTSVFRLVGDLFIAFKELTDNGVARFIVQVGATTLVLGGTVLVVKSMVGALVGLVGTLTSVSIAAKVVAGSMTTAAVATTGAATAAKSFTPIIFVLSAAISAITIGISKWKNQNEELKASVESSRTAVNDLKDAANGLQNSVAEVDKKIVSLESRFENLRDDPAAVAVEMANLQNKALELGVSLETKLTNSIDSVIEGWRELRTELGKEIIMNLDRQFQELNLLSERMALLRSQEARSKPQIGSDKWLSSNGLGFIADHRNLKNSAASRDSGYLSVGGATFKNPNGSAANLMDILKQVESNTKNQKNGATADKLYASIERLDDTVRNLDSYSPEDITKNQPKWNKEASEVIVAVRQYADQMRFFINNSKYSKDVQDNARQSLATLTALAQTIQEYQNKINSAAKPAREARTARNSRDVESYVQEYESKANQLKSMSTSEHRNLKYNDSRLDSYMVKYGKETNREWLIPLLMAIKNDGEKSNMNQKSPVGARSVMQFMPDTWEGHNGAKGYKYDRKTGRIRDINNAADVIEAAFDYMEDAAKRYKTRDHRVLAAEYNGGYRAAKNVLDGGNGRFGETIGYVKRVDQNIAKYQDFEKYAATGKVGSSSNPKLKGYEVVGGLEVSENAKFNMERKAFLEGERERMSESLAALGDITKLSGQQKEQAEEYRSRISALDRLIAQASSETMNVLKNSQLKHQEDVKRKDKELKLAEQRAAQELAEIELEVKAAESVLIKSNMTSADTAELGAVYRKLQDAKAKQLRLKNQIANNLLYEYSEDKIISDSTLKKMSDEALAFDIQKLNQEMELKRKKAIEEAHNAFIQRVSSQNSEFVRDLKNDLEENAYAFDNASAIVDFSEKVIVRNNRAATGLDRLERERALMDDIRFRDKYTDTQRTTMDKEIERLQGLVERETLITDETRLKMNQEQIVKVEALITEAEIKRNSHELKIRKLIEDSTLSPEEKKSLMTKLDKELNATKKELNKYQSDLFNLQDAVMNLEAEIKIKSENDVPKEYSVQEVFSSKIDQRYENLFKAATMDSNIESVIDSINNSFGTFIDTVLEASDSFDDFFKMLTFGSHESKEAFKAFGYSILKTMVNIMRDAIVTKFMKFMKDALFPAKGANGQIAAGGSGGTLQTVIGTIGSVIAGAFGSAITGGTSLPQTQYRSQGGLIRGSAKNVDSVPVMAADKEYILPSNVTETVGLGFLERLRNDPKAAVDSQYNINNIVAPASKPSMTNVYVVSPDKMPSSVSPNDIVVSVEDNINRGGSLKKLIQQVVNNG